MSYTPRHRLETGPSRSKALYLLPLAGLAVTAVTGTGFSSAAYTASSITTSTVTAASDWTPPTVALRAPATFVRGDVALTATASDVESGIRDVVLRYRAAGTATWTSICTDSTSPFGCTWSTAGLTTGTYELQAVATDRTGLMTTTPVATTTVDNTAPVVTLADPGSPLAGTKQFVATATDQGSGVTTVRIEAVSSTGAVTLICATTSCSYDTKGLANGTYSFRAVATDAVGNVATSALVAGRTVQNTNLAVALGSVAASLSGTVSLTASIPAGATASPVTFHVAPAGTAAWTTLATAATSPYSFSWNTLSLKDGLYDIRATVTDGTSTVASVVTNRRVDNNAPTGVDVQGRNGVAGSVGRFDAGDVFIFTFSEAMNLDSILGGWDGSPRPITLELAPTGISTAMRIAGAKIGTVNLGINFNGQGSATFGGTISAALDDTGRTVVTITVGDKLSGGQPTGALGARMAWMPVAGPSDLFGRALNLATVTEVDNAILPDTDF